MENEIENMFLADIESNMAEQGLEYRGNVNTTDVVTPESSQEVLSEEDVEAVITEETPVAPVDSDLPKRAENEPDYLYQGRLKLKELYEQKKVAKSAEEVAEIKDEIKDTRKSMGMASRVFARNKEVYDPYEILNGYTDPDELDDHANRVDTLARNAGYIKADEVQAIIENNERTRELKNSINTLVVDFFEAHPDKYSSDEESGELMFVLENHFNIEKFYSPDTPREIKRVMLEQAHNMIYPNDTPKILNLNRKVQETAERDGIKIAANLKGAAPTTQSNTGHQVLENITGQNIDDFVSSIINK